MSVLYVSSGIATGGGGAGARAPSTPPDTTHEIHANPKTFFGWVGVGGGVWGEGG